MNSAGYFTDRETTSVLVKENSHLQKPRGAIPLLADGHTQTPLARFGQALWSLYNSKVSQEDNRGVRWLLAIDGHMLIAR